MFRSRSASKKLDDENVHFCKKIALGFQFVKKKLKNERGAPGTPEGLPLPWIRDSLTKNYFF